MLLRLEIVQDERLAIFWGACGLFLEACCLDGVQGIVGRGREQASSVGAPSSAPRSAADGKVRSSTPEPSARTRCSGRPLLHDAGVISMYRPSADQHVMDTAGPGAFAS